MNNTVRNQKPVPLILVRNQKPVPLILDNTVPGTQEFNSSTTWEKKPQQINWQK